MSWAKKGEYEIAMDDDVDKEAKKNKITIKHTWSKADWWSPHIKIDGETPTADQSDPEKNFRGISTVGFRRKDECLEQWKGVSEEIPGLHCYFCDSQGFKTDMPGVAVCGAAPAWFFFYRRIAKETKPTLKIVNGELVETTEEAINL